MERAEKRQVRRAVRNTLIYTLRRGSLYHTHDPELIKVARDEQEKIAKQIERKLK